MCSFVTSGTFRGSGIVTEKPNKGRYYRLFWFFVKEWANYVRIRQCYSMKRWFTLLNRPNMVLKKALLWEENRNQIEHRTGFLKFYVKTKKVCRCFANFSSERTHFTHGMYITALIRPPDLKNQTDHVLWSNDAKVFRRCSDFAIAVVVTSHSSSFEYTILGSNPRPLGLESSTLPLSHCAPYCLYCKQWRPR